MNEYIAKRLAAQSAAYEYLLKNKALRKPEPPLVGRDLLLLKNPKPKPKP